MSSIPLQRCPSCGADAGEDARFCRKCGTKLVDGTATERFDALAADTPLPPVVPPPRFDRPTPSEGRPLAPARALRRQLDPIYPTYDASPAYAPVHVYDDHDAGYEQPSDYHFGPAYDPPLPPRRSPLLVAAAFVGVLIIGAGIVATAILLSRAGPSTSTYQASVNTTARHSAAGTTTGAQTTAATSTPTTTSTPATAPSASTPGAAGKTGPAANTPGAPGPAQPSYNEGRFGATPPPGWRMVENGVQKPGYVESKWHLPGAPGSFVLVDMSSGAGMPPGQAAKNVRDAVAGQPGYQQVGWGQGDIAERHSMRWVFTEPGTERVDYFFRACGNGYAVLGATTPTQFGGMYSTFRAFADSVEARCS
jgi:zinc ribbon protein